MAGKVRSIPKSGRNFLSRPKSKIDDFIQKKIRGDFLKMSFESHVSQHDKKKKTCDARRKDSEIVKNKKNCQKEYVLPQYIK